MGGIFSSRNEITLKGHIGPVHVGRFSNDCLITAGDGVLLHRWNQDPQKFERLSSKEIESLSISPDGVYVAIGLRGGEVSVIDAKTKVTLCTWSAHEDSAKVAFLPGVGTLRFLLTASKCEARCWSIDRRQLAPAAEPQRLISVWETMDCQSLALPHATRSRLQSVPTHADSFLAALGSSSGVISLHQVPEGNIETLVHAHKEGVFCLCFSPCGRWLASGSEDREIKIWDRSTWTLKQILRGHSHWVLDMAFSPDGERICSVGDKTLRIWHIATENVEVRFELPDYALCSDWCTIEKAVLIGTRDGLVRVYRLT